MAGRSPTVQSGEIQRPRATLVARGPKLKSGIVLLSHAVTHIVPSALRGLTSLFGMGRGVTPSILTPEEFQLRNVFQPVFLAQDFIDDLHPVHEQPSLDQQKIMVKSFDLLVLLDSFITELASVAYQPTHLVGVLFRRSGGKPHLGAGFALRCFQCLSHPDMATEQCHWRDNSYTVGPFTLVLSY